MTRLTLLAAATSLLAVALWCAISLAEEGPIEVPDDPGWITEDIEAGYKEALTTGKPLLVAFR